MPKNSPVPGLCRGLGAVGLSAASFLALTDTYRVGYSAGHLVFLVVSALVLSVLLSLKGRRRLWVLPVTAAFLVYALWNLPAVIDSLREVGNHYIRAFNAYNSAVSDWASTSFSAADPGLTVLAFVLCLTVCSGVWLLRSPLMAALPLALVLGAGILTNQFPTIPILAASAFLLVLLQVSALLPAQLGTAQGRRQKLAAMGYGLLGLGAVAAILAALVGLIPVVHPRVAAHSGELKRLQASFVRDLPATLLDEVTDPSLDLPRRFRPAEHVLNNAPIEFSGQPVMEALADSLPGQTLYLKSKSFGTYRNGRWDPLSHPSFSRFLRQNGGSAARALEPSEQDPQLARGQSLTLLRQPGVDEHMPYRSGWPRGALGVADGYMRGLGNPQSFVHYPWSWDESGPADSAYEDFVHSEYLKLPANSGWIDDFTRQWEGLEARDLVEQVRRTLAQRASYSMDLSPVPPGSDYVYNFLFVQQKGYCQHFASAGVLLLRGAGIPARFATGYAVPAGLFAPQAEGYRAVVSDELAHAWPEIYLSGVGWVPVEMTPGGVESQLSGPIRPEETPTETPTPAPDATASPSPAPGTSSPPTAAPTLGPEQEEAARWELPVGFWQGLGVAAAVLLALLLLWLRRRHIQARRGRRQAVLTLMADLMGMLEFCLGRRQGARSDRDFLLWAFDRAELPGGDFVAELNYRHIFSENPPGADRAELEKLWALYSSTAQALRRRLPGPKRLLFDWAYCYNLPSRKAGSRQK